MNLRPHLAALIALCAAGCDAGGSSDRPSSSGSGGAGQGGAGSPSAGPGAAGGDGGASSGPASSGGGGVPASNGYYVMGNRIHRQSDDGVHVFRGVARPSMEWNPSGENLSAADFALMASWGANVTRLSLNQSFWAADGGYRTNVDTAVGWAHAEGMDVILDLHWSDKGGTAAPGQQRMADAGSLAFWQSVAERYQDDGRVLFELYNEPHDTGWAVWLNGGPSGDGFEAVGMQELYDAVRATGAPNLVLVGGVRYAYDLTGVPLNRVQGYNIVYVSHPYDHADKQPANWDNDFGFLTATDPVMATEFGGFDCGTNYVSQLLDYMENKQMSWTGWAWYPGGCNFPSLINDWGGNPTAPGQLVKDRLQAN
jgi:hypothetical protein